MLIFACLVSLMDNEMVSYMDNTACNFVQALKTLTAILLFTYSLNIMFTSPEAMVEFSGENS